MDIATPATSSPSPTSSRANSTSIPFQPEFHYPQKTAKNHIRETIRIGQCVSGNRTAMTLASNSGAYLLIREAGAWGNLRLGPGTGHAPLFAFNAQEKLEVLHLAGRNLTGEFVNYVQFTEKD